MQVRAAVWAGRRSYSGPLMLLLVAAAVASAPTDAPHQVTIGAIDWTATPEKVASTASTVEVS